MTVEHTHQIDDTANITWNIDAPANTEINLSSSGTYVTAKVKEPLEKQKPALKYISKNIGPNRAQRRAYVRQQRRQSE